MSLSTKVLDGNRTHSMLYGNGRTAWYRIACRGMCSMVGVGATSWDVRICSCVSLVLTDSTTLPCREVITQTTTSAARASDATSTFWYLFHEVIVQRDPTSLQLQNVFASGNAVPYFTLKDSSRGKNRKTSWPAV